MTTPAEILSQLFAAYTQDDNDTLRQLLAEDVLYHIPGRNLFAGDYKGRRAVLELWARQKEYLGGHVEHIESLDMLVSDEHVVLLIRGEAEGRGKSLTWRGANLYTIRAGQVVECWPFVDDLYAFDNFWSDKVR